MVQHQQIFIIGSRRMKFAAKRCARVVPKMAKRLPCDVLVMLHNRLNALRPRDPERRLIIKESAHFYGVSQSTVYRALHHHNQLKTVYRKDYNHPRSLSKEDVQRYCELIAALKVRTTNKKGRHLSTKECIRLIEHYGVETEKGLIKTPPGLLKRTTIDFYLKRFGLDQASMHLPPTVVHFEAIHSNDCWQFDFSPSDFKHFPEDQAKRKSGESSPILMLASVVDDRSGVMYQEYHSVYGEDTMTALKFLFNSMAPKKYAGFPFQGIPRMIYMDNGPVSKSTVFKRVMAHLGIEVRMHQPEGGDGRRKTARAKGKVERPFRTVKESLETLYHLHPPRNLSEANEWLRHYLQRYNQEDHRREKHSRLEDWKGHLPSEGFRAMCDWERFSALAREPEIRKVGSDACVVVGGTKYQLSPEFAGLTVTLLWGLFDQELRVEQEGQYHGPFYPAQGPIPLGQYRPFKKSQREIRADCISNLAKQISIPRHALGSLESNLLAEAGLTEEQLKSVPFTLSHSSSDDHLFKNTIEAKAAIARWLGFPLGRLHPEQLTRINTIIAESLDKKQVMSTVKQLFEPRLITKQRTV
jgi:hypothetical protein